jgi:transcriptional regulator with XRE-family HTH domain
MLEIPEIVSENEITEFKQNISTNIKRIREEQKLTQLEVALLIGQKSAAFYACAENNSHNKHFNLVHLFKLSTLFKVDISEFFK